MYIYNVTVNIDEAEHDRWLLWMKDCHIPEMLATGKFLKAVMSRVIVDEDMGGITYSVQYFSENRELLKSYYREDAERLRGDTLNRFPGKLVAFRTELEVVHEHVLAMSTATEYLFIYGTLREESVQERLFSRRLEKTPDQLRGYGLSVRKVAGCYPTIEPTGDREDYVEGEVCLLSARDLLVADAYEGVAYRRIKVRLASGTRAWVFLGNLTGKTT